MRPDTRKAHQMTKEILNGTALRDWDRLTPERRAWYSMGAAETLSDVLDALPDSVIEHHPGGLKSLQAARRRWIAENSRLGDDYARKAGLL
nr:MAG TPA: hypothetical protein [Caudoviricetes sp.]